MPLIPTPSAIRDPCIGGRRSCLPADAGGDSGDRGRRQAASIAAIVLIACPFALKQAFGHDPELTADAAATLNGLAEVVFVAGLTGVFGVCWHSRQGHYRLRHVVVGTLCLVAIALGLGGLAFNGVVPPGPGNAEQAAALTHAAHMLSPLTLIALASIPGRWAVPKYLYFALLSLVAGTALLISELIVTANDIPGPASPIVRFADSTPVLLGLFVAAMLAVLARPPADRAIASLLFAGALGGGVGAACFLNWPQDDSLFHVLGKAGDLLAVAAIFHVAFAEAIAAPYREIEDQRSDALSRHSLLDAVVQAIGDGMLAVDEHLDIVASNAAACSLTGHPRLTGRPLAEAMAAIPAPGVALTKQTALTLKDGRTRTGQFHLPVLPSRGDACWLEYSITRIRDTPFEHAAVLVLHDASERRQFQQRISDAAEKTRSLIEANPDPMFVADLDGRIVDVNAAAVAAIGVARHDILGNDLATCFDDLRQAEQLLRLSIAGESIRNVSLALRRADGGATQVVANFIHQRNAAKRTHGILVIAHDVTDLLQTQIQMKFQAECDALTALPNRRDFLERVARAIARCNGGAGRHVAVMLVDLDNFRDINDTLGHAEGDELLKRIATRLRESLRETDTVARFGGDEFAILLEDIADPEDTHRMAEKVFCLLGDPLSTEAGKEIRIACSIGVSVYPLMPGDANVQISNADTALYQAKESGKGRCSFFSADLRAALDRRIDIARQLGGALGRRELTLHYQPQMAIAGQRIIGVEALLRWKSEALGSVSPAEFIPVAESTGLILPIGQWVLDEACRQAALWQAEFGTGIVVAVNLSARQFKDADVAHAAQTALDASGLAPHLLEVEITESMLMGDIDKAAEALHRLKTLGVRVAIDDFGTGYSSLGYLQRLPLDTLKIDRSFIVNLLDDGNDDTIVRSIVGLAHHLDLKVIAEGVETAEQMRRLSEIGCDEIQGYHIGRPCPPDDLRRLLRNVAGDAARQPPPSQEEPSCLSAVS